MPRIQSELSARQLKTLIDTEGEFAKRKPAAYALFMRMRADHFHICDVHIGSAVAAIHLGCGAVVSIYQRGTVMVQGRINTGSFDTKADLERVLPASTVWQLARE
jgi:hypothetical protein